jgi:hypothetical protein
VAKNACAFLLFLILIIMKRHGGITDYVARQRYPLFIRIQASVYGHGLIHSLLIRESNGLYIEDSNTNDRITSDYN